MKWLKLFTPKSSALQTKWAVLAEHLPCYMWCRQNREIVRSHNNQVTVRFRESDSPIRGSNKQPSLKDTRNRNWTEWLSFLNSQVRTIDLQVKRANMTLKIIVFFIVDVLMIALAAKVEINSEEPLFRDSQLGKFSALFMRHDKHRLTAPQGIHGTTTKQESCISCGLTCGRFTWCFSFNCGINPYRDGKHVCEILSTDKYNNSEGFQPSQEFHHFSIMVRNFDGCRLAQL